MKTPEETFSDLWGSRRKNCQIPVRPKVVSTTPSQREGQIKHKTRLGCNGGFFGKKKRPTDPLNGGLVSHIRDLGGRHTRIPNQYHSHEGG